MSIIKKQKQYKTISNDWKYIRRYNNLAKSISRNARDILFSALYQIKKYGHAILTHEALSEITETKNHQNCILIKQLGFILDAVFFRSLVENDKKYRDGYKLTLTKNAEEILENPRLYFAKLSTHNSDTSTIKIADMCDQNRRSPNPLYIYKKKENKNDTNDHREDQLLNSDFQIEEKTDFVESPNAENDDCELSDHDDSSMEVNQKPEYSVEKDVNGLAMNDIEDTGTHSRATTESIETSAKTPEEPNQKPKQEAKLYKYKPIEDRVTRVDKNGNEYWGIPLMKYRYSKAMLEEVRLASDKQDFTHSRISGLFKYLADRYPDKLIIGGRKGFIQYMTKVVNGEKDYEKEAQCAKEAKKKTLETAREKELAEFHESFRTGTITKYKYG